jgi:3-hydroxyacyl-CoA dehydrogenase/enoyl-CoA hydratase/3-hydroxybutyryl-CoA epimerase
VIDFKNKDGIGIATIDQANSSANILNEDFFKELNKLLDDVEKDEGLRGLVFTSAKRNIFLAGADLVSMYENLTNQAWLSAVINTGQEAFNRIEELKIPTVSAIHGACLGGGLELSLACKYRIASADKCTKIGLPEVMLGILPAWGGTTRLPRTIGLPKSLSAILSGKAYTPKQARKIGIIDKVCHKENLTNEAIKLCKSKRKRKKSNALIQSIFAPLIFYISRKKTKNQTRGNYPAPEKIINVIAQGVLKKQEKSLTLEKQAFLELSQTEACKNLIRLFFLQERAKKNSAAPPWYDAKLSKQIKDNIVVVGAGTMGAGIAQWISSRGKRVILKDISVPAIAEGLKKIGKLFVAAVLKHKMDRATVKSCLGKLSTTTQDIPLANNDLAIEAVVENFKLKAKVLKHLESRLSDSAILATNTSALSITELAKHLKRPENFIGIHFFNPVHKMKLVEVVVGEKTSAETQDRALRFVRSIGKLPVVVKDSPGFLVNRILMPYLIEAIRLFSEGNPPEVIDGAMLDFGMPMGPLRLLDEIGLDVAAHVALDLEQRLPKFSVPKILHNIVETKKLGRKSGQGFYIYRRGKSIGINTAFNKFQRKTPTITKIPMGERMVKAMTDEAEECILERIAINSEDIDFAMVMGAGWAPFRGGPMRYLHKK